MAKILRYGFFFLFDAAGKPRVTHCIGFSDRRKDDLFVSTAICGINEKPNAIEGLAIAKKRVDRMARTGRLPRGNEIVSPEALSALAACGKTLNGKPGWDQKAGNEWIQNKCYSELDCMIIRNGGWMPEFKFMVDIVDNLPVHRKNSKFICIVTNISSISTRTAGTLATAENFQDLADCVSKYFEKTSIKFKRIPVEPIESKIDKVISQASKEFDAELVNRRIESLAKRIDILSKKIRTATAEL